MNRRRNIDFRCCIKLHINSKAINTNYQHKYFVPNLHYNSTMKLSIAVLSLFAIASTVQGSPLRSNEETSLASSSKENSSKKHRNGLMHAIYDELFGKNGEEDGTGKGRRHLTRIDSNDLRLVWKTNKSDDRLLRDDNRNENEINKMLLVMVTSVEEGAEFVLRPYLEDTNGFETIACGNRGCDGYLSLSLLELIENLPSVARIVPSMPTFNSFSGKFPGASISLQVDSIRKNYPNITGAGLKIGIMSDSFNVLEGYADDISSGDLPNDVVVVKEASFLDDAFGFSPFKDEGRAMAQLIHDIAPDAKLYFRTVAYGQFDMAEAIKELAELGCDVLVDDVEYFSEEWFQEGVIAQAVNDIVREKEIPYFSSAGNGGRRSWQGPYNAGPSCFENALSCHDFGNGNGYKQRIKWNAGDPGQVAELILQWDESSAGSPNDLDLYIFDTITGEELDMYDDMNVGGFPEEVIFLEDGEEYDLAIGHIMGPPPTFIKWKLGPQEGEIEANPIADASTIVGHANSEHAAAVGAASEKQTFGELKLQSFSSAGGTPISIDREGKRFKAPKIWNQPRFVSADASSNSFFGIKSSSGGARFYGTSASAPNAAGIALLMKQAAPNLSPSQIYKIMENTAIDMNEPGFDFDSGYGFVNGLRAVKKSIRQSEDATYQSVKIKNAGKSYCNFSEES